MEQQFTLTVTVDTKWIKEDMVEKDIKQAILKAMKPCYHSGIFLESVEDIQEIKTK